MESVETVVIGAGIIGLAVARRLAATGQEVVVLESEASFNTGISSRNSEVIHAGIYYRRNSLKAHLSVAGRKALYRYCESHGIAHARLGKLIVATDESEIASLRQIQQKAADNGVHDLEWLDGKTVRRLEPAGNFVVALLSPSTGIVDSHALSVSFLGEAEADGAIIAYHSPFLGGRVVDRGFELEIGGDDALTLHCRQLVNCAGLNATWVASAINGFSERFIPKFYMAKGSYFALMDRSPFKHLIYPAPVPGGLGTHLTMDLAGRARFGPDVEWVQEPNFDVDPSRVHSFYRAVRRYWPDLPDGKLCPDYAGIRPKLHDPSQAAADFLIQGPIEHGIVGLVCLFGIESPGLTCALSIAEYVAQLLGLNPRLDGSV